MDEMVMRPPLSEEGVPQPVRAAAEGIKPEMPWLERERLGVVRAWFRTVGKAMGSPSNLMDAIPEWTPRSAVFAFAAMNSVLYFVCGSLPGSLLGLVTGGGLFAATSSVELVLFGIGGLILQVAFLYVWFRLTHALLRLTGGVTVPESRTWQALGYSSAAGALSAVPMSCVAAVGGVWWTVSAIIMLARAHGCHGGRAALATILAGLVAAAPGLALAAVPFYMAFRNVTVNAGAGPGALGGMAQFSVDPLGLALLEHLAQEGDFPVHALILMDRVPAAAAFTLDGTVDANDRVAGSRDLLALSALIGPGSAPLAGGPGADGSEVSTLEALAAAAAAALPADRIGHRVGDWMFVYEGRQPSMGGGLRDVWIAVAAPPGGARELFARTYQPLTVITGDGARKTFQQRQWSTLLRSQNRMRASIGLPALPEDYSIWCGSDVLRAPAP